MGPTKHLEGCQLEREGPSPAEHYGRSTGSVSNKAQSSEFTVVHLTVWFLLLYYGDTLALSSKWLEGVLLWNTLLEDPYKGSLDKTMPPHCGILPHPLENVWKGC